MASGDTKTEALMNALENGGDIDGIAGCCNTNLQNYIIDSIDSVTDAKDAIQNKGGTVDYDAGLSSLASEIATIPSGGTTATWGTVTYVDTDNVEHTVEIQNEDEYLLLGNSNNVDITIGGDTFKLRDITRVDLGTHAGYAPPNFLDHCSKLTTITGVDNLIYVEYGFLSSCTSLDCELNFAELLHCGDNFLNNCSSLNHAVYIPELRYLSNLFMANCRSYAQTLTLNDNFPSSLIGTAYNFMNKCDNFTNLVCNAPCLAGGNGSLATTDNTKPMYVDGVTLTGTYANDWKTALADRTSSPYRKLILGS